MRDLCKELVKLFSSWKSSICFLILKNKSSVLKKMKFLLIFNFVAAIEDFKTEIKEIQPQPEKVRKKLSKKF